MRRDTSNRFGVGVRGDKVVISAFQWSTKLLSAELSKDQALNLAAWLAVLADPEGKDFQRIIEEIKKP